ncbi:TIGR03857 family LLM class F420-dependent oxidoreductase [Mycobacterium sp. E1747]|uniref:TIGR03857 family LLM class F420-dependent oxidoreductase n=1 Tax=Mycobacterium sp. E1747 TaxID=1834128 RepID=UPI000800FDE1|nr:TIGR03857 family LLM class F420-dependent oxidoreductase [Mycobacterium sp. E1747]OBH13393.1 LLM class F420-dependent oxidoreductase [Mycobacterium sp. E1747]
MSTQTLTDETATLAPVVDDMSIYVVPGRVKATIDAPPGYTPLRRALTDAIDAERLGFRRLILSERHGLKDAPVLLSAAAAHTTRLEIGTGAASAASRHPVVAGGFGATMQALHGPRMIMGLGRGDVLWNGQLGFDAFVDYAKILRRLWHGEKVTYDGPAGTLRDAKMDDVSGAVPPPQLWYFALGGGPRAARAAADPVWDGIVLYPFLTPEAVRVATARIRSECERRGRDPDSLHVAHCITSAPELDESEMRAICHARLVTYLQWPSFGDALVKANGWDMDIVRKLRNHAQLRGNATADQRFHRVELLEPAKLIPDEWITQVCAVGSVADCIQTIAGFREQGPTETILYGSTPRQNAALLDAWRARRQPSTAPEVSVGN